MTQAFTFFCIWILNQLRDVMNVCNYNFSQIFTVVIWFWCIIRHTSLCLPMLWQQQLLGKHLLDCTTWSNNSCVLQKKIHASKASIKQYQCYTVLCELRISCFIGLQSVYSWPMKNKDTVAEGKQFYRFLPVLELLTV